MLCVREQVASALITCSGHKASAVRYKVALHLDECLQGTNGQRLSGVCCAHASDACSEPLESTYHSPAVLSVILVRTCRECPSPARVMHAAWILSSPCLAAGAQGMLVRVFKAAVTLLDEGREDTRVYAKRVLWATAQLSAVTEPGGFDRMLKQLPSMSLPQLMTGHCQCLPLVPGSCKMC